MCVLVCSSACFLFVSICCVHVCKYFGCTFLSHECCHPFPLHRTRGTDLLNASTLLAYKQKPLWSCWYSCIGYSYIGYISAPFLSLSPFLSHIQKLLGNSLLKLEGDDRLDINCTLPLTDQVFH